MFRGEFNNNNYNQPVHDFLNCSVGDAMLLVYTFYSRHNLTWVALEDLVHLVNTILGQKSLPTTKYSYKKKFELPAYQMHIYCIECQKYLGGKESFGDAEQALCSICNEMRSVKTKYNKKFFITMPIDKQITSTLERAMKKNQINWSRQLHDDINDICDGELYQNLIKEMNGKKFISLCISTDGVVLVKSSKKKSLWPIQFIINEIHPKFRFKRENIICAAFSFGDTPNMSMFFKQFVEDVNEINRNGGLEIKINGCTERILVIPLLVTMDSVAKCHVAGITQFNGHYGCPYCHHRGTIIPPAKNVKYCIRDNARERLHGESQDAMIETSTSGQVVNGYRNISPVLALDTPIDAVWIFTIDKMHSTDLGVVKKLFKLFFDSQNSNAPYFLGKHIQEIDKRLERMKLPRIISRSLRKMSHREYFHAYEWKYMLLFAAYSMLIDILAPRYFAHLMKLVEATHILCSTQITSDQLDKADNLLQTFVQEFEDNYGGVNMVFNVHLLLHTVQCVRKSGPLFTYSNYAFEDNIGYLGKFVRGPTDPLYQITDRYLLKKSLKDYLEHSDIAKAYNYQIEHKHFSKTSKLDKFVFVGKARTLMNSDDCSWIRKVGQMEITEEILSYRAVFVDEKVYFETVEESKKCKTYDAFVCNPNCGIYGEIKYIIMAKQNVYFVINNKYKPDEATGIKPFIYKLDEKQDDVRLIIPSSVESKYAFIKLDKIMTCTKFPNLYERN